MKIVQIGFGGIGTRLTPLIRQQFKEKLYVIDKDKFEAKNLNNQNITIDDLNKPKARVAAERYKAVGIEDYYNRLILLSLMKNQYKKFIIISCVDNINTRIQIGEDVLNFNNPNIIWIDLGVYLDPKLKIAGGHSKVFNINERESIKNFIMKLNKTNSDNIGCLVIPGFVHNIAAQLGFNSLASVIFSKETAVFPKNIFEYDFMVNLKSYELQVKTRKKSGGANENY